MSFATFYRVTFYLMLFLATLALNVDASIDFALAPLYPAAVAVAAVVALLTVDRNPKLGLSRDVANVLAVGSIALSLFEYWYDENLLVLAMGHWLVYLQIIKMFLPKTVEDDWFLFLLAVTQVIVGAFQSGDLVGAVLMLWALVSLCTLGLFYLRREALRPSASGSPDAHLLPAPTPGDPYPGFLDTTFLTSALKVAFLTLALGCLIFLAMPRWETQVQARSRAPLAPARHLTGFSETVRLGQMGEILESEAVVMSVELYDEQDQRVALDVEPYWRGVALLRYASGQWSRPQPAPEEFGESDFHPTLPERWIRQKIKLEPSGGETLFALRPIYRAKGADVLLNRSDGTIYRGDLRPIKSYLPGFNRHPGVVDYEVISAAESEDTQPGEFLPATRMPLPNEEREIPPALEVPPQILPRLQRIVEPVLEGIPADDTRARARALERSLLGPEYSYSLAMEIGDASLDPVIDFLENRRQGHCEYFASALTLMLRASGIPARLVNGFKGGDWNELGQVQVVRQKHAHSWVEAYLGRAPSGRPVWLTLDPTPARGREESVARVGGWATRFRFVSDYLRYIWVFYIVGFDAERQNRLIYGPIKGLMREARQGFGMMGEALQDATQRLFSFPSVTSFFSVRGFLVSFGTLLLLFAVVRALRWVARRLLRRFGAAAGRDADAVSGVASYRRLVEILARIGLRRPPAETPREFALRASETLTGRGGEAQDLAGLPSQVVEAFYGMRFGDQVLEPERLRVMEDRLDSLEAELRPTS